MWIVSPMTIDGKRKGAGLNIPEAVTRGPQPCRHPCPYRGWLCAFASTIIMIDGTRASAQVRSQIQETSPEITARSLTLIILSILFFSLFFLSTLVTCICPQMILISSDP